ncbi:MAG TPA: transposase [Terriglobales bacterium]|nr:transposase [Terriglobales bacterium]
MKGPTPRRLWIYVTRCLGLRSYFRSPGDGRPQPQIPAKALLWSVLIGQVLRACSFLAVERLVRSSARRALVVSRSFSDDALDYFTERLDPTVTRVALARVLHQAKRNKAFENSGGVGIAVDGSTVGWCASSSCSLCRPYRDKDKEIAGYRHHLVLATVVGTGLSLPFDVEPYGPGDSEYAAGQRLLCRAVELLGGRFAAYVVVDGEFATAPFLHAAGKLGLPVVARLKANLPELLAAAQKRFRSQPPILTFSYGDDRVELWDAEDFDPWENLRWESVRVLRYRQHKPDGEVIEAFWLTNFSIQEVSSRVLYHRAKSRWEVENQGFNDAKNRHDLEHICHHHPNSLLITWLLTSMALTIERLYRLRYLRRGTHPPRSAADFVDLLWLSLSEPASADTS